MSDTAQHIAIIFFNAFTMYFLLAFFDMLLCKRFLNTMHRIFQILSLVLIVTGMYLWGGDGEHVMQLMITLVFAVVVGAIFYKDNVYSIKKPSAVSIMIIYMAYATMLSGISVGLITLISGEGVNIASVPLYAYPFHIAIDVLVMRAPILAAYVSIKRWAGKGLVSQSGRPYFLYLLCAAALVLVVVLFPLYATLAYSDGAFYGLAFVGITLLMATLVFIVLSTIYHRIALQGQAAQLGLVRMRNELLIQNLNDAKLMHHERGKLAHDMKEHLSVLYTIAKEEGSQKLCAYIETMHYPLKDIVYIENTGDEFLDTILTVKKQQALKQGVVMDIECSISAPLNIEPIDLTAILSNLLQNALEACEKVEHSDERYVFVNIKQQGAFLNIKIENSANAEILGRNRHMHTTKNDKSMHGIGLKSVRSSVERYQGDIIFESRDDVFIVCVVLCLD